MNESSFGNWPSPISAEGVAAGAKRIGGLVADGDDVYWVESRPAEGGRMALVRRSPDGETKDVLPATFSVRTRVHEYGGGAVAVHSGQVAFVNDVDQRIYLTDRSGHSLPQALTPFAPLRYADLLFDPKHHRLICVVEERTRAASHDNGRHEPENYLAAVPLSGGGAIPLARGADFYSSPCLSPDGRQVAFLRWNHPQMPWDGTELVLAQVDSHGHCSAPTVVAGSKEESVFQPSWSPSGELHFVSDRSGWWNLYRRECDGAVQALCPQAAEFGTPQWVFGLSTYAWLGKDVLVCAFAQNGTWHLGLSSGDAPVLRPVESELTEIAYVRGCGGRVVFLGASPTRLPAIWSLDAQARVTLWHEPSPCPVSREYVSQPEPISFATSGGATAYGLFYPAYNPDSRPADGERPPLLVISHGGPTAAASATLSLTTQFWTTRGFAVLDVNYRGSSGYGREYRRALRGQWGVVDVDDCVAGALHVVRRKLVDGSRLAIRGSSAGGYTTLCALVFRDTFKVGASYYGVSDLELLANDTHKFESRYLDSLVGEYPAQRDRYRARSPIHSAGILSCPVIFFQGQDDQVVPPSQAQRMVAALRERQITVEYLEFAGEQHGFRRSESIVRALEAELAFYRKALALE